MAFFFRETFLKLAGWFTGNSRTSATKRRRNSSDEEEDLYISASRTIKRRTQEKSFHTVPNMATGGSVVNIGQQNSGSQLHLKDGSTISPSQSETKENDIYELTDEDDGGDDCVEIIPLSKPEPRPPLSQLPLRHKLTVARTSGELQSQPINSSTPKQRDFNDRMVMRKQDTQFVTPVFKLSKKHMTPSNSSSSRSVHSRKSTLDEVQRLQEKNLYSIMLSGFHNNLLRAKQKSLLHGVSKGTQSENVTVMNRRKQHIEVIDLTKSERTRVPIQNKTSDNGDSDIEEIFMKPSIRVNSMERRLQNHDVYSPQWILDMQKKYSERDRELKRQIEEAEKIKNLYSEHSRAKLDEVLVLKLKERLALTNEVVLDDTEEEVSVLPELTDEMKIKIENALRPVPPNEVLVEGFGQRITRRDFQTLKGLNWLNDEVINFYMNLLIERSRAANELPSVYAFNTFFYPKLSEQGHSSLRRWTRKVDVFAHDVLVVPVHLKMHWCVAVIDFRDRTIRYYDSMGQPNDLCLEHLRIYLKEESMDKKKQPYDTTGWKLENVTNIPQQMNGSDCGVFSCMFAEYICRNAKITFTQQDMPYFRRKIVYEILNRKLIQ